MELLAEPVDHWWDNQRVVGSGFHRLERNVGKLEKRSGIANWLCTIFATQFRDVLSQALHLLP